MIDYEGVSPVRGRPSNGGIKGAGFLFFNGEGLKSMGRSEPQILILPILVSK